MKKTILYSLFLFNAFGAMAQKVADEAPQKLVLQHAIAGFVNPDPSFFLMFGVMYDLRFRNPNISWLNFAVGTEFGYREAGNRDGNRVLISTDSRFKNVLYSSVLLGRKRVAFETGLRMASFFDRDNSAPTTPFGLLSIPLGVRYETRDRDGFLSLLLTPPLLKISEFQRVRRDEKDLIDIVRVAGGFTF